MKQVKNKKTKAIVIKLAKLESFQAVKAFQAQEFNHSGGSYFSDDRWREAISDQRLLIATSTDQEVCGFLYFTHEPTLTRVNNFRVANKYQGSGIGEKLMESFLAIADTRKVSQILSVGERNTKAIELYKKFGFVAAKTPRKLEKPVSKKKTSNIITMRRRPFTHIINPQIKL